MKKIESQLHNNNNGNTRMCAKDFTNKIIWLLLYNSKIFADDKWIITQSELRRA